MNARSVQATQESPGPSFLQPQLPGDVAAPSDGPLNLSPRAEVMEKRKFSSHVSRFILRNGAGEDEWLVTAILTKIGSYGRNVSF